MIHPTVIVSKQAHIADDVEIGAFSIIEDDVEIGAGCQIEPHVIIRSGSRIGTNNHFFQFCSVGEECQNIYSEHNENHQLVIGNDNIFREYCSLHKGSSVGDGVTTIGSKNFIMNYTHIGHDCVIGNNNIIAPGTNIGGHVTMDNHCILGGGTLIHQFCTIGSYTMASGGSIITGNVPAFALVYQTSAKACSINRIGMKRQNITSKNIDIINKAFKILFKRGNSLANALSSIKQECEPCKELTILLESIMHNPRGNRTLIQTQRKN